MNKYLKANQTSWDKRAGAHFDTEFYRMDAFLKGENSLKSIELQGVGSVEGKSLLHLQCHFGQDTLSWARLGAKVTGVDFSDKAIKKARELNEQLGLDATFIQSDVLELDKNLEGQFDIVFTSYGVLGWLPNLKDWARIIGRFLKPGGLFYIVEFHPTLLTLDFKSGKIHYDYFHQETPLEEVVEGTYADRSAPIKSTEYYWIHSMHETIQPLLDQGLQLIEMEEYPYCSYPCFDNLVEQSPGKYVHSMMKEITVPYLFSLKMRKE